MQKLTNHIAKLRNQAVLVQAGIPSAQASRIIFNDELTVINTGVTFAEHMAKISLSLTNCIQMYLNQLHLEELDEFVMCLESTKLSGMVNAIFCDHDGVWEIETGTFGTVSLGEMSFDDRLIMLDVLEHKLQ